MLVASYIVTLLGLTLTFLGAIVLAIALWVSEKEIPDLARPAYKRSGDPYNPEIDEEGFNKPPTNPALVQYFNKQRQLFIWGLIPIASGFFLQVVGFIFGIIAS